MTVNFEDSFINLWDGNNRPGCVALGITYRDADVRKSAEIEE